MENNLKLNIAGIVFSYSYVNKIHSLSNTAYENFVDNGTPEIKFRCLEDVDYEFERLPKKALFTVEDWWELFSTAEEYILKVRGRTLVANSDFTSGEIYVEKNWENPCFSYPLDELLMINLLSKGRGLLVHACGMQINNLGVIFLGNSQAGKSTTANLWKDTKDVIILSDDRVVLRKLNSQFWLYGTPWHGDAKASSAQKTPLHKIFFLKQAKENNIRTLSEIEAISRLIRCSFLTFWDNQGMDFSLSFCSEIVNRIPCFELGFLPDKSIINFVSKQL